MNPKAFVEDTLAKYINNPYLNAYELVDDVNYILRVLYSNGVYVTHDIDQRVVFRGLGVDDNGDVVFCWDHGQDPRRRWDYKSVVYRKIMMYNQAGFDYIGNGTI